MQFPENATPLIVFGRQRAGTRLLAGALNQFPEVAIQGELPNPVMDEVTKFVENTEQYYRKKAETGEAGKIEAYNTWKEKKERLIFSLWVYAGQSTIVKPGSRCRYFGYKRPNNEFHFSFYEEHFQDRKPVYVYCARNFVDNYLSIASRWPERTIRQVAGEYLASIRQYRKIRKIAPDRVLSFILDEYIADGIEYLERNVLSHLELKRTSRILEAIAAMGPKNSSKLLNVERRTCLTLKEQRYVAKHPELQSEFESICG